VTNDYLQAKNNMAVLLLAMNRPQEALDIERYVLAVYRQANVEDRIKQCLSTTGRCAHLLGRLDEAERDLEEALAISMRIFGPQNISTSSAEVLLVQTLLYKPDAAADWQRSLQLCENSYKTCRRVLKEEHVMTGNALMWQAAAMIRLGMPGADEVAKRGLDLATKQLGAQAIDVIEMRQEWDQFRKAIGL